MKDPSVPPFFRKTRKRSDSIPSHTRKDWRRFFHQHQTVKKNWWAFTSNMFSNISKLKWNFFRKSEALALPLKARDSKLKQVAEKGTDIKMMCASTDPAGVNWEETDWATSLTPEHKGITLKITDAHTKTADTAAQLETQQGVTMWVYNLMMDWLFI